MCLSCYLSVWRNFSKILNVIWLLKNKIKTIVRELAERTFNAHLFGACLLTECAYSQTEHEPQGGEPLLKRRYGESNKPNLLLNTVLVLAITNRTSTLCSQNKTDKNPNRNSARVLAWWMRATHASGYVWAIWARRVKQHILWMCCSQSERGGLLCKRRSPNTWGRGKFYLRF